MSVTLWEFIHTHECPWCYYGNTTLIPMSPQSPDTYYGPQGIQKLGVDGGVEMVFAVVKTNNTNNALLVKYGYWDPRSFAGGQAIIDVYNIPSPWDPQTITWGSKPPFGKLLRSIIFYYRHYHYYDLTMVNVGPNDYGVYLKVRSTSGTATWCRPSGTGAVSARWYF